METPNPMQTSGRQAGKSAANRLLASCLPEPFGELLEQYLAGAELELPVLPEVAVNILSAPLNERTDLAALSALIERDQALAAQVIRVTNSVMFGGTRPVLSIQQALTRLGLQQIRSLALAIAFKSRIFSVDNCEELVQELWRTSSATAAWARELSLVCRTNVELSFTAGLLQQIGKPVVLLALVDIQRRLGQLLPEAILRAALKHYHILAGLRLAKHWNLPPQVTTAIEYAQRCQEAPRFREETMVVALAGELAQMGFESQLSGGREEGLVEECVPRFLTHHPIAAYLDLTAEQVAKLWGKWPEVHSFVEVLGG